MSELWTLKHPAVIGDFRVVKATDKRATVRLNNPTSVIARDFTFIFDGTGYKRQGQYLRVDRIK